MPSVRHEQRTQPRADRAIKQIHIFVNLTLHSRVFGSSLARVFDSRHWRTSHGCFLSRPPQEGCVLGRLRPAFFYPRAGRVAGNPALLPAQGGRAEFLRDIGDGEEPAARPAARRGSSNQLCAALRRVLLDGGTEGASIADVQDGGSRYRGAGRYAIHVVCHR
jgi:hypothetical protein